MTNSCRLSHKKLANAGREYPVAILQAVESEIRSDLHSSFDEWISSSTTETERFKYSYLREELFSKYLDPSHAAGAHDREEAAIRKWQLAELRNEKTNVRLTCLEAQFGLRGKGDVFVSSDQLIDTARRYIVRVLGESPWVGPSGPSLDILLGTFTSGASTQFARGDGLVGKKFMEEAHATAPALPYVQLLRTYMEGWRRISDDVRGSPLSIEVVRGSVLFTVPKTSEIDRCACKEPGLNMFLQKGVGAFLRRRLRSVARLDLSDQTRNQNLARIGSLGSLATIDLSSASDTISNALVFRLLPSEWFHYLNAIRSQECCVNGEWVELSMFSSMGNAFTFELETLIFWALSHACKHHLGVRGTVSVYGDDIIVPVQCAGFLARCFSFFGFKVNPKKSYWSGPFRESCGKHWHKGTDVTPFYVREPITSLPRLIHFCNRLRLWAGQSGELDERVYPIWIKYARLVPRRLRGGTDLDSIGQLVSTERPDLRLVPMVRKYQKDEAGQYLHWLRAADGRARGPGLARGRSNSPILIIEGIVTSGNQAVGRGYKAVPSVDVGQHGRLFLAEEFPILSVVE